MKKELLSSYHQQAYWENTTRFEPQTHGKKYPLRVVALKDIWASVPKAKVHLGKVFFEPLKEDIAKNGLHNPILTIHCTREELKGQKAKNINDLPFWLDDDMQQKLYVAWGGSNRVYAAMELGYTHIECALVPTFNEARNLQKCHRHTHQQYYPERYWE
jgi:hypothetical protein